MADSEVAGDTADGRAIIDDLFTGTFDSVLRVEERVLAHRLTRGLTINEVHTIVAVGLNESNPMKTVAERRGVTLATLTTAVNRLVEKGYIERERGTQDRRQVFIHLTHDGKRVYRAHHAFHNRMIDEALGGLSDDERRVLAKSLTKLKSFFDEQGNFDREEA